MKIGCVNLVRWDEKIVAIECSKGRGVILPGGKLEPPETFKACARRELFEETGLLALSQKLVFQGPAYDGFWVMAFLTSIGQYRPKDSSEGKVVLATWEELLDSEFESYYELLFDVVEDICTT